MPLSGTRLRPPPSDGEGSGASRQSLDVEALDARRHPRARRADRRLDGRGLPVRAQRRRRPRTGASPPGTTSALAQQNGLILDSPTNILLLGTDHADERPVRTQHRRALGLDDAAAHRPEPPPAHVPLDPARPRRDDPGGVYQKINAAMQIGGPKLAIQTVDNCSARSCRSNHVVVVDFGSFEELDRTPIGGIDVNVPENVLSNRFDCPYSTQARCDQWQGWRFRKGVQHMNGHTGAHLLAHPREPARPGVDGLHARRRTSRRSCRRRSRSSRASRRSSTSRSTAASLLAPISTDLSTWDFLQLGWVKFRAGDIAPLPARRLRLRQRDHHKHAGEHLRRAGGARERRAAAAVARVGPVRPRLRDRESAFSEVAGYASPPAAAFFSGAGFDSVFAGSPDDEPDPDSPSFFAERPLP